MKITNAIRWILLLPTALVAWYAVVALGMILLSAMNDWCPFGEVVSDMCYGPFIHYATESIILGVAGLSAFVVVFVASKAAPNFKLVVAVGAFACGGAIAAFLAVRLEAWLELTAALAAGSVGVVRQYARRQRNKRAQLAARPDRPLPRRRCAPARQRIGSEGPKPRLPTEPCVRVRTRLLTQGVSTDQRQTNAGAFARSE
jgi:hypothetical protein